MIIEIETPRSLTPLAATSNKQQAISNQQATGNKQQATSNKQQQATRNTQQTTKSLRRRQSGPQAHRPRRQRNQYPDCHAAIWIHGARPNQTRMHDVHGKQAATTNACATHAVFYCELASAGLYVATTLAYKPLKVFTTAAPRHALSRYILFVYVCYMCCFACCIINLCYVYNLFIVIYIQK